ncbi:MAG TPA: hypothetical protein VM451_03110 [Candidatus Limnocylindria bacterium]|nr:hypothetical protein [Candidatus Limnocylindria bacterium]
METQGEPLDGSIGRSLRATYRSLLARGLETGEAANLTAFLHGLPSAGFHWSLPEIEAIIHRRIRHAADLRTAERAALPPRTAIRHPRGVGRATVHDRRSNRAGFTHVIDPPTP